MRLGMSASAILVYCLLALCAYSTPISVPGTGIVVYPPEEVLGYCKFEQDRLVLIFKDSYPWILDATCDSVFPMDANQVVDAIREIDYPLDRIIADVLILPFVRMQNPKSSAEGSVVFLSPGVSPYLDQHVHYTTVHEIGHILQHKLMPQSAIDLWDAYLSLRGIQSDSRHISPSVLREMFAEDFRLLFGGDLARFNGASAIRDFELPQEVPGLREFMLGLAGQAPMGLVRVSPNPFRDVITLEFNCSSLRQGSVKIFNSQGQLVKEGYLDSAEVPTFRWDGRSVDGRQVSPGVYFVTIDSAEVPTFLKVIKLPR